MKLPFDIIKNFYYFYSFGRGRGAHVWRSEGNLSKSGLSFCHVGARDGTPVDSPKVDFCSEKGLFKVLGKKELAIWPLY